MMQMAGPVSEASGIRLIDGPRAAPKSKGDYRSI